MMRRGPRWLLALLLCWPLAHADEASTKWSDLPDDARKVLKPYEGQWNRFPAERRERLLQGVERWQGLNPEQRKIMASRFKRWQAMTPEQQIRVREHFKRYRQLRPLEREVLKHKFQHFQKMSPQRKQALRDRWKNLSPDDRKQFREKRMQRMPEPFGQDLPGKQPLPADKMLDRPGLGDIQPLDAPQTVIRER